MGKLAYAAKITHVPSMYLSEIDGPIVASGVLLELQRRQDLDGHGRLLREEARLRVCQP